MRNLRDQLKTQRLTSEDSITTILEAIDEAIKPYNIQVVVVYSGEEETEFYVEKIYVPTEGR